MIPLTVPAMFSAVHLRVQTWAHCPSSWLSGRAPVLTVTPVQELCDDGSAAHRPGPAPVNLNQRRRHHLVVPQLPEYRLTGLHVVMGHIEDVT